MHLKNRWNKRARKQSLEDIAGALSFISWKIATDIVVHIENQGFVTDSQAQRLEIIGECLAFLLQIADRLSYDQMDDVTRQHFITTLALKMAQTFADNKRDVMGEGTHREAFIDLLNQRAVDYAGLNFHDSQAGFDLLRYFGQQIAMVMQEAQWLSEYIVDIKGPAAVSDFKKSMDNLLSESVVGTNY